jgi:hypothetical protein
MYICVYAFWGKKIVPYKNSKLKNIISLSYVHRTNQTLDKHVGDSTDSDNEEKEGRICMKEKKSKKNH